MLISRVDSVRRGKWQDVEFGDALKLGEIRRQNPMSKRDRGGSDPQVVCANHSTACQQFCKQSGMDAGDIGIDR
ncbi:MAG TPA: hypothetical protein VM165_17175, partial [Planctomycetaceae bacterium]|nr:hypothetical protein [Planctomycetaceae bacterium]